MTITEVHREINTDRYTAEGLRWIIMFMSCANPDLFRDATDAMNGHMREHPNSRKDLINLPVVENVTRCCGGLITCQCNIRTCTCTCDGCFCG